MISGLIEKGYAYPVDGDVYFRVTRDADYGRLSGRKLADMQAGARINIDDRKEHPMDFALWKAARPGEPAWDSPWGQGRPGWHIECSAMNLHHLGEQIDIHGGGNDLVFPHHENEIAQTESLTGKPFARYWVHNGMLQLGGEKMAKSTGNLISIEEFLSKYSADSLRFTVLNANYRGPLSFTDEVLSQSENALTDYLLLFALHFLVRKEPPRIFSRALQNRWKKHKPASSIIWMMISILLVRWDRCSNWYASSTRHAPPEQPTRICNHPRKKFVNSPACLDWFWQIHKDLLLKLMHLLTCCLTCGLHYEKINFGHTPTSFGIN